MQKENFDRNKRRYDALLNVLIEGMVAKHDEILEHLTDYCQEGKMIEDRSIIDISYKLTNLTKPSFIKPFKKRLEEEPTLDNAIFILGEICEQYDKIAEEGILNAKFIEFDSGDEEDEDFEDEEDNDFESIPELIEEGNYIPLYTIKIKFNNLEAM